jgi:SnoaL-like protein
MGRWSREELQRAHDHYVEVAQQAGRSGDWRPWADMFTDDVTYVEHHYGTFEGREALYDWITETMHTWPNSEMKEFPHDWCVCDEERGWWICQIENRFRDPGDGETYQAYNLTVLKYAGDMQFSSEEDAYNPANFAPVVKAWIAASRAAEARGQG